MAVVRTVLSGVVLVLVVAGCSSATGDSIATGDSLTFLSFDGDGEIFVMNADGAQVRRFTDNDSFDGQQEWSPDGKSIAFAIEHDGDKEIFVMNADGTQVRQLTDNDENDGGPVWSPDGKSIGFTSGPYVFGEIVVVNADGTGVYSTGQEGILSDWGGPAN